MTNSIPIGVTARNEAKNILAMLASLRAAIARASRELGCSYEIHVLLNDNDDNTVGLLRGAPDHRVWHTRDGIVEAQRMLVEQCGESSPFLVFSDADILVEPDKLLEISRAMFGCPEVEVAYASKYPIPPGRPTALAKALYLYNLREGYQTARHYFNGQFFAIRKWRIPKREGLHWKPGADTPFLNLEAGIRCDDIYLSREILGRAGPEAIRCLPAGIRYYPPATLYGMFRRYQKMRLEIERLDRFFPGTNTVHRRWGRRRLDRGTIARAPLREKAYFALFQAALVLCKIGYYAQKAYFTYLSVRPCPTWSPVKESRESRP